MLLAGTPTMQVAPTEDRDGRSGHLAPRGLRVVAKPRKGLFVPLTYSLLLRLYGFGSIQELAHVAWFETCRFISHRSMRSAHSRRPQGMEAYPRLHVS